MSDQSKLDFQLTATTKLRASMLTEIDEFASINYSNRSETLRAVIERVWEMVRQQKATRQSLRDLLNRVRLEPA